jgi:hypothetical protein
MMHLLNLIDKEFHLSQIILAVEKSKFARQVEEAPSRSPIIGMNDYGR